jgi:cytochrome P450
MIQVMTPLSSSFPQRASERVVTDYRRGRALLEHPACIARPPQAHLRERFGSPGLDEPHALLAAVWQQLLFADGPTHRRLRAALDGPLAHYSARLTPFIRQTAAALLAQARPRGEIDLETDFAAPLAICALARLLGWPDDQMDVAEFASWSTGLADLTTGHAMSQALPAVQQMAGAFRAHLAAKQVTPEDDLASVIATSPAFVNETERVVTLMALFGAGTSTTISTLVNSLPLLLGDSERLALLRRDLAADRGTLSHLVNDLLRLVTPTQYVRRWLKAEVTLDGERLTPGCPVQVALAAMNRDPACFPHPALLDWHRPVTPAHAAFGFGTHACPGAPLARLEIRLALEALLRQPHLRLLASPEGWNSNPNQRRARGVRLTLHERGQR